MDADTVVVGAPYEDTNGANAGSAYIFTRNEEGANDWGQTAHISATDGAVFDLFGYAVAVQGDTVVVGATSGDGAVSDTGAVYIYSRNESGPDNWGQTNKITVTGGTDGDQFGWAVAVDGGTIVVGAPEEDGGGTDAGAAPRDQSDTSLRRSAFARLRLAARPLRGLAWRHTIAPEMCSPPSTRITSPLTQAASSVESR